MPPFHYIIGALHILLQADEGVPHVDCKQWCMTVAIPEDLVYIIVLSSQR